MSTSVTVINVQSMQPSFTAAGLGPIPAGTTADAAVATIQTAFATKLRNNWPSNWPAYVTSQQDQGIMGPWSANLAGTAPPCLVQQITMDFNNWELPVDTSTINDMASQITEEISANGGTTGTFTGRTRIGGAETIYWGVAFGTGAIADNPEEMGIIYVFSAQLGVN